MYASGCTATNTSDAAVPCEHAGAAETLLQMGAAPSMVDQGGRSACHYAFRGLDSVSGSAHTTEWEQLLATIVASSTGRAVKLADSGRSRDSESAYTALVKEIFAPRRDVRQVLQEPVCAAGELLTRPDASGVMPADVSAGEWWAVC